MQSRTEGANGPLRCRRGLTPGGPPDARSPDPNVIGAPRRKTHPRPLRRQKSKSAVLRRLRACSVIIRQQPEVFKPRDYLFVHEKGLLHVILRATDPFYHAVACDFTCNSSLCYVLIYQNLLSVHHPVQLPVCLTFCYGQSRAYSCVILCNG